MFERRSNAFLAAGCPEDPCGLTRTASFLIWIVFFCIKCEFVFIEDKFSFYRTPSNLFSRLVKIFPF